MKFFLWFFIKHGLKIKFFFFPLKGEDLKILFCFVWLKKFSKSFYEKNLEFFNFLNFKFSKHFQIFQDIRKAQSKIFRYS